MELSLIHFNVLQSKKCLICRTIAGHSGRVGSISAYSAEDLSIESGHPTSATYMQGT